MFARYHFFVRIRLRSNFTFFSLTCCKDFSCSDKLFHQIFYYLVVTWTDTTETSRSVMILLYVLDALLNALMCFSLPPCEVGDAHFTDGKAVTCP